MIHPLGEQIIIRTIKPDSVGSIIIPDSAKAITKSGESSLTNQLNFVEAEVIAVGPGKRSKDPGFAAEVTKFLRCLLLDIEQSRSRKVEHLMITEDVPFVETLLARAENHHREPLTVKPGDRILYHPAVQKFDRQIDPELIGLRSGEGECFIIREESVLAILEEERSATQTDSAVA